MLLIFLIPFFFCCLYKKKFCQISFFFEGGRCQTEWIQSARFLQCYFFPWVQLSDPSNLFSMMIWVNFDQSLFAARWTMFSELSFTHASLLTTCTWQCRITQPIFLLECRPVLTHCWVLFCPLPLVDWVSDILFVSLGFALCCIVLRCLYIV